MSDFTLDRDAFGRLVLTLADASVHVGVVAVRAFPIAAPHDGIALMSSDGHELVWLDDLEQLSAPVRELLEAHLASREFVPEIKAIRSVSSFATPSIWIVDTDRGETRLVLKGEEGIRRLARSRLLIADSHGIHYLIRDRYALDAHSRKILDRFL